MLDRQRAHPVAGGGIQPTGYRRVGLKETLRADPQRHLIKDLPQRLLFGEEDLLLAFHDCHMHRLDIRRDHLELRELRLQPRQRGAQLSQLGL